MMRQNWADIDDLDDEVLPSITTQANNLNSLKRSQPDANGVFSEYSYVERNGQAVKCATVYKQKKIVRKTNPYIEARRAEWVPFGKCIDPTMYSEYGSNKPVRSEEDIKIELSKEKQMKTLGQEEKFWENSIILCENILNDAKKKKYDTNEMRRRKEESEAPPIKGIVATGGAASNMPGKYVPPSLRGNAGPQDNRNENTLRVTNLSEDTREGDVQNLFSTCGRILRVFMPKHKEGEKEGMHKGFAFVQFADAKDGDKAIKVLNGHGYDKLILRVSWAQPKAQ